MQYIETLAFTADWPYEKRAYFNTEVNQIGVK
jgi:hypothetical protein